MKKKTEWIPKGKVLDVMMSLHDPLPNFFGVVYIIGLNNDCIKIGRSAKPLGRLKHLLQQFYYYSDLRVIDLYVSEPHTNYYKNENAMHRVFFRQRKAKSEMFKVCFANAVDTFKTLPILDDSNSSLYRH